MPAPRIPGQFVWQPAGMPRESWHPLGCLAQLAAYGQDQTAERKSSGTLVTAAIFSTVRPEFPGEGAETAPLPAPFWCTIPVEPAHFDWRSRERPALALLAWEALSRDPLARLRRIQVESIGTTINFARSLLRLQPELDQAAAEPVAQREATAATSHGLDPPAQSHCYFPLALSRARPCGGSA